MLMPISLAMSGLADCLGGVMVRAEHPGQEGGVMARAERPRQEGGVMAVLGRRAVSWPGQSILGRRAVSWPGQSILGRRSEVSRWGGVQALPLPLPPIPPSLPFFSLPSCSLHRIPLPCSILSLCLPPLFLSHFASTGT